MSETGFWTTLKRAVTRYRPTAEEVLDSLQFTPQEAKRIGKSIENLTGRIGSAVNDAGKQGLGLALCIIVLRGVATKIENDMRAMKPAKRNGGGR